MGVDTRRRDIGRSDWRWRPALLVLSLLLVAIALQLWAISIQSMSGDGAYHLLAGHQALRYGQNSLNLEHPPLVKLMVSLPLLTEDQPLAPPLVVEQLDPPVHHHRFAGKYRFKKLIAPTLIKAGVRNDVSIWIYIK